MVRPRDQNLAGLQRLAQRVERLLRKLRQFVEKQYALVRKRDFPRFCAYAAANERGH